MGILIGMDEAGYGPNYGPLVVAATAWHAPDAADGFCARPEEYGVRSGGKFIQRLLAVDSASPPTLRR